MIGYYESVIFSPFFFTCPTQHFSRSIGPAELRIKILYILSLLRNTGFPFVGDKSVVLCQATRTRHPMPTTYSLAVCSQTTPKAYGYMREGFKSLNLFGLNISLNSSKQLLDCSTVLIKYRTTIISSIIKILLT